MARMHETRSFVNQTRFACKEPSEAYTNDGGRTWLWAEVDRPVPLDACRDYGIPCDPEAQRAAVDAWTEKVLAEYRAAQPAEPSAEEQFEMRAAFGPGAVVVDVITGRKFRT